MVLISLPRKQCNLHQEHCYSPANPHRCGTSPQTAPPRCCNFKLVLWQGGWSESRGSTGFLPHVLVMPLNSGGILRIFKDFNRHHSLHFLTSNPVDFWFHAPCNRWRARIVGWETLRKSPSINEDRPGAKAAKDRVPWEGEATPVDLDFWDVLIHW